MLARRSGGGEGRRGKGGTDMEASLCALLLEALLDG